MGRAMDPDVTPGPSGPHRWASDGRHGHLGPGALVVTALRDDQYLRIAIEHAAGIAQFDRVARHGSQPARHAYLATHDGPFRRPRQRFARDAFGLLAQRQGTDLATEGEWHARAA